jgi:hypothetical protein
MMQAEKRLASAIANEALRLLREQGLDCVGGGYDDVSQKIHTAILHAARAILRTAHNTGVIPNEE